MSYSYSIGARGMVVRALQEGLGVLVDGVFGKQTQQAVMQLQMERGIPMTGQAGQQEFVAAGLEWPTEFERAMNLVSNFEGTSFGDCNSTDIDGAGLTLGIAGFTTRHGEVQELLARYFAEVPGAVWQVPGNLPHTLMELMARQSGTAEWARLFYNADNRVKPSWRRAFDIWGSDPVMQRLQLEMARQRFWRPAIAVAASLGFASLKARVFMLDVAVQNGGWRSRHLEVARQMDDWHSGDEARALVVAARAVAACAKERQRNDVLSRKMAIATGRGVVHGRDWRLKSHALA